MGKRLRRDVESIRLPTQDYVYPQRARVVADLARAGATKNAMDQPDMRTSGARIAIAGGEFAAGGA
jgi:hypothetical protein